MALAKPFTSMTIDQLPGQRVTVVGAARSGKAVARLLAGAGASVFVTEQGPAPKGLKKILEELGVAYEFEGHTRRALATDCMVISPGVPSTADLIQQAQSRAIPVFAELEVAFWFCQAPIIAVTGTNGKTTTTRLLDHIYQTAGRPHVTAGNIGTPFSACAATLGADSTAILEVSSFQLDYVDRFRPTVSVLLNITADHLDRYNNSLEQYARSKSRIFKNQTENDVLIYNDDDQLVRTLVRRYANRQSLRLLAISCEHEVTSGAFVRAGEPDQIVLRLEQQEEIVMAVQKLALRGRHNTYNSLAAAAAAQVRDIQNDVVRRSLRTFQGVSHRLETVGEVNGVLYVDDSKATNVNALWYALESFERPIVLIAGGRDKGNDYSLLQSRVRDGVRAVVALGESADKVQHELGAMVPNSCTVETMDQAVKQAAQFAQPGDVVLLSPACSSLDMFEDYKQRGNLFKQEVQAL